MVSWQLNSRASVFTLIAIVFMLSLVSFDALGQNKKRYQDRSKSGKGEVKKSQQEAAEKKAAETPFAPRKTYLDEKKIWRDDHLWKSQTAGIIYPKAVNVSLYEPSKWALNRKFQLECSLPLVYHTPNIFGKYQWSDNGKWQVATRHGAFSATTGFKQLQSQENYQFVDSGVVVPLIVSLKNEFIVSRSFSKAFGCTGAQPYLVLSGIIGGDWGYAFDENELTEIDKPFLANRSPGLIGKGYDLYFIARGDYKVSSRFLTGASLRYFYGTFSGNHAFEQKAWLETLISPTFSVTVGYGMSVGNYDIAKGFGFIPTFDLCWYFGQKSSYNKGLFGNRMF